MASATIGTNLCYYDRIRLYLIFINKSKKECEDYEPTQPTQVKKYIGTFITCIDCMHSEICSC